MWWRMFTVQQQQVAKVDYAYSIQIQVRDRGASYGSQAAEIKIIGTPGKMLTPIVLPRMEERNRLMRHRIKRIRFVVLRTITTLTRERQVFFSRWATPAVGQNMFHGKRLGGAEFRTKAVFADFSRTLLDQLSQTARNAPSTHVDSV